MRTRDTAALLLLLSIEAGAQSSLNPMTVVRITMDTGRFSARVVSADSTSLVVELPSGARRTMARSSLVSIERHGGRALVGAKTLGITGVALGALAGLVLVQGLCETSSCNDDVPPAMFLVGAVFGTVGAATGAFLGHNGSWQSVDPRVEIRAADPVTTCINHPRVEAQLGQTAGMLGRSHRQFSVGAVCGSGTVIGVDVTRLGTAGSRTTVDRRDSVYGLIGTDHQANETRDYRGAFVERPIATGAVRFAVVAMAGVYRTDSARFVHTYMKEYRPDVDWRAFRDAYPVQNLSSTRHEFGGGVGLKASLAIGPQVGVGFASRLHEIGSARQHVESGMTISFRP
jgi:hypothetical protein